MSIDAKDDVKMKCDELKADKTFVFGEECEAYKKPEVDSAIDELKREHHRERDEYIDWVNKQQKENAELKRRDTEHTVHIAKMNADLRKTQRALWLARSRRAFAEARYNNQIARRYEERNEKTIAECYDKEVAKWKNSDRKCRAKAKEYE